MLYLARWNRHDPDAPGVALYRLSERPVPDRSGAPPARFPVSPKCVSNGRVVRGRLYVGRFAKVRASRSSRQPRLTSRLGECLVAHMEERLSRGRG
jgi:hypothetical protein